MNEFYSVNGNLFTIDDEVVDKRFISLRATGYLITHDGRVIVVPAGGKHHGEVFMPFLTNYLEMDIHEICKLYHLPQNDSVKNIGIIGPVAARYGLIGYYSVIMNASRPIIKNEIIENSDMYLQPHAGFFLPPNFEDVTDEQLEVLETLVFQTTVAGTPLFDLSGYSDNKQYDHDELCEVIKNQLEQSKCYKKKK